MPDLIDAALPDGYRLLAGLLTPERRHALIAELAALPPGAAGQRELLAQPSTLFQSSIAELRADAEALRRRP